MMRRIVMLGIFVSLIVCTAARSSAQVFCWVMQPFPDRLLVSVTNNDLGFNLSFIWQGPGLYQILGPGMAATTFPFIPGSNVDLGLIGTQPSTFFGGNPICGLDARVTTADGPNQFTGIWRLTCPGSPATATMPAKPTFTVAGIMAYDADCDGTVPAAAASAAAFSESDAISTFRPPANPAAGAGAPENNGTP